MDMNVELCVHEPGNGEINIIHQTLPAYIEEDLKNANMGLFHDEIGSINIGSPASRKTAGVDKENSEMALLEIDMIKPCEKNSEMNLELLQNINTELIHVRNSTEVVAYCTDDERAMKNVQNS